MPAMAQISSLSEVKYLRAWVVCSELQYSTGKILVDAIHNKSFALSLSSN